MKGSTQGSTLRNTLLKLTLVPILVLTVILTGLFVVSALLLMNTIKGSQNQVAEELARQGTLYINDTIDLTRLLSHSLTLIPQEQTHAFLKNARQNYPRFTALYVLDRDGKVVEEDTRGNSRLGTDLSEDNAFRDARRYGATVVSNPFISPTTGQVALTVATPVRSQEQDQPSAVLLSELDLTLLQQSIEQVNTGPDGISFIVDSSGTLIAYPDSRLVRERQNFNDLPLVQSGLSGKADFALFQNERWNGWMLGSAAPMHENWSVFIIQPLRSAARPLSILVIVSIVGLGASLFLLAWLFLRGVHRIASPISELARDADHLSHGDLYPPVDRKPSQVRELNILQARFDQMVTSMVDRDRLLEQRVADRTQRLETVAAISERLNSILHTDLLLTEVVRQIQGNLHYPFVSIFMLNDQQELVIAAASGEAGQIMLDQRYAIPLDTDCSLVATAARFGKVVNISDIKNEPNYLQCDYLPDTSSEICVPIISFEAVIGVIDVQTDEMHAFDPSEVDMFRSLANQIGISIHNAQLYTEMESLVIQRTQELVIANLELQSELAERRRAETALSVSQSELSKAQKLAHLGSYAYNLQTGEIHWSEELKEILGETRELPIDELYKLTSRDEYRKVVHAVRRLRKEYKPITLSQKVVRRDGTVRYIEQQAEVIFDDSGQPQQIIGVVVDATQRRLAEIEREQLLAQVREQAQQVREIMNTVPEGVLLLNAEGTIVLANPAAEQFLGPLAGADDAQLVMGQKIERIGSSTLEDLLSRSAQVIWQEIRVGERIFEAASRPVLASGLPRWVLVLRDITNERAVQRQVQQQERLAAVGQLAAGIAHDFNNIMAVILLYTDIMLNVPDLPPKQHERLNTIALQARRAADLIQQILDFSRRSVLERRPMDLQALLKEQVKLLQRTVPEDIEITLTCEPGSYTVDADPTRIQQAIMNLVFNARDSMPEGGKLHIQLQEQVLETEVVHCVTCGMIQGGAWARIIISDTGTGIPADVLPHIFEPFYTTKSPGKGTGLGLAQVFGIAKQHEGHINVCSTPGDGAQFSLYLPLIRPSNPAPINHAAKLLLTGNGQRILVCEDEPATQQAIVDALTMLNYQVSAVSNGREALEVLEQEGDKISLVLSDVIMPEMSGITLYREMQKRRLPVLVVLMSGHPIQDELERLQGERLVGFLQKPTNTEKLARIISIALKKL